MKKIFIGIDFAKEKFDAAIIEACGLNEVAERRHASFPNEKKGYRQLVKWVKGNCGADCGEWLFCGEDTGSCSLGLSKWLYGKGLDIWIENAYAIRHSCGIQRVKSDKSDAFMIAEYAWRHQDKAAQFEPLSESLSQLREVFLYRHKLVQQRAAMEVRKKDKEASQDASKAISFIKRKSKRLMAELDKAIKECDGEIDRLIAEDPELAENYAIVTSIKGVARQNGVSLLVYTNNFKRFGLDAKKLACYYGVAPFGKESGTSVHTPAHTSHFANKLIKALLGQAAQCARLYNDEIRDYYGRLMARGKKHSVAINNIKNKLLKIIVALVRKRELYDPESYKICRDRINAQFLPA